MAVHTIHLRGPWTVSPLARTRWTAEGVSVELDSQSADETPDGGQLPPGGQLNPVGSWAPLLGDFCGRVLYVRPFRRPTGIDGETVWLVVEGVDAMADVELNGEPLGSIQGEQTLRVDISGRLQPQNRLALTIDRPAIDEHSAPLPRPVQSDLSAGGLIGGARLEIESQERTGST